MSGEFGYTGKILRVDLTTGSMSHVSTSDYTARYIGGRGIAAKVYWDEVPPEVKAFDAENRLIFMTGPLCGLSGPGSRWQVCGKSPVAEPDHFWYSNMGGTWGASLRFAGYDGVIVQGKSERPVYLFIEDGTAELRDASALWGKNTIEAQALLKEKLGSSVRIATIGPAGENRVPIAVIFADPDSTACGLGAVMGAKRLKAIAVKGSLGRPAIANQARFDEVFKHIDALRPDGGRVFFKWLGAPPLAANMKRQVCYGCRAGCSRATYEAADGDKGKNMCGAARFYQPWALKYYGQRNDVPFKANRLCNIYGVDTNVGVNSIARLIQWLSLGYEARVLTEENTGIPLTKIGSLEFVQTLISKVALREGFGDVLAQGIHQAAASFEGDMRSKLLECANKTGQDESSDPRLYIVTALLHATQLREPMWQQIYYPILKWKGWSSGQEGAYMSDKVLHALAKRFWGSEIAADFSTYNGKSLAAKMIQDRDLAMECLVLCVRIWPISDSEYSEDHAGDPTIESQLYSAVTGREMDETEYYRLGEKVFNLQRAILVREGHRGRDDDRLSEYLHTVPLEAVSMNPQCLVPGKDGAPLSRKGAVVDREKFAEMLGEYYQLRGWDPGTGLQTKAKLQELGLGDVAKDLEQRGLVR